MPGPYPFGQILAADPFNPAMVARNAMVLLFAPGDATMSPLVLWDLTHTMQLPNPVKVTDLGFGPAFIHDTLDQVAWEGGGLSGTFESYRGMKDESMAARAAAEGALSLAKEAADAAADAAQFAAGPTDAQVDAAVRRAAVPSNLSLAADGVPYILPGANQASVYAGTDGNYYFTI